MHAKFWKPLSWRNSFTGLDTQTQGIGNRFQKAPGWEESAITSLLEMMQTSKGTTAGNENLSLVPCPLNKGLGSYCMPHALKNKFLSPSLGRMVRSSHQGPSLGIVLLNRWRKRDISHFGRVSFSSIVTSTYWGYAYLMVKRKQEFVFQSLTCTELLSHKKQLFIEVPLRVPQSQESWPKH